MSTYISGSVQKTCNIECKISSKLTASSDYTRYVSIDSINFPTRACNDITNLVVGALYPLNEVPGTKTHLTLIESLHDMNLPKISKEFQSLHVIKD